MGQRVSATSEDCCETGRRRAEADLPRRLVTGPVSVLRSLLAPVALLPVPLAPLLVGALAAVALAGLALAWRGGFRRGEARRLARNASLAGDSPEAIRWLRRARHEDPHDPDLGLEEAWHLAAMGRVEEALGIYGGLAGRLGPGRASWLMATTLFEHGGDPDRIEALVVDALRAEPGLEAELRLEPDLQRSLAGRPAFERAWQRAREANGGR
jgi:hypothetical protein